MLEVRENHYSGERFPWHAHPDTTVTIVLAGQLRERVGFREEIARSLSIVVKPASTEHANEFGTAVHTLQIVLSGDRADSPEWNHRLNEWRWDHGGPAVPAFLRLLKVRREAGNAFRSAAVEMAAADALAALSTAPGRNQCGAAPCWLQRVKECLDDELRPESVRELARVAGVHPVYLARQFRRWYGHSITEHIGRQRVQRAAGSIANTDRALSSISYETGFADQSHMCRVFARETGMTPRSYRRLVVG